MRQGIHTVGSTGDSYDTMAETFDRLSQRELIYRKGPWTGHDAVEFGSTGSVYVTPAEFGDGHDRQSAPAHEAVTQRPERSRSPAIQVGRSRPTTRSIAFGHPVGDRSLDRCCSMGRSQGRVTPRGCRYDCSAVRINDSRRRS